jgi:hypothetical protein
MSTQTQELMPLIIAIAILLGVSIEQHLLF